jgi:hypothetical protein
MTKQLIEEFKKVLTDNGTSWEEFKRLAEAGRYPDIEDEMLGDDPEDWATHYFDWSGSRIYLWPTIHEKWVEHLESLTPTINEDPTINYRQELIKIRNNIDAILGE